MLLHIYRDFINEGNAFFFQSSPHLVWRSEVVGTGEYTLGIHDSMSGQIQFRWGKFKQLPNKSGSARSADRARNAAVVRDTASWNQLYNVIYSFSKVHIVALRNWPAASGVNQGELVGG